MRQAPDQGGTRVREDRARPALGHRGTGARRARPVLRASACAGALLVSALLASCAGPAPNAPRERVLVPKRATLTAVADSLRAHQIISSPRRFLLTARVLGWLGTRYRGLDRHLRPGRYEFAVGEGTKTILDKMLEGKTSDDFFTVPEGATIDEMAHEARVRLGMDSANFVAATQDSALRAQLGVPPPLGSIEGYLFPDTYRVVFGASARQLVEQMVQQFLAVWDSSMDRRAAAEHLTRHEVVTLASIVEGEARFSAERPIIAGVYLNRLRRRPPMKLDADPTVIYALGKRVHRVLLRDLQVSSPYNTYLHPGLPPGPIDSPGRASIMAVLYPAHHDYLYFVARPDGSHMFSSTAREHADSVAVARRLRAAWQEARRESEQEAADSAAAPAAAPAPTRSSRPPLR
jgi:UPF0755 protein